MKESVCKTYDDLPLFLNADQVAKALGVASSSAYDSCMKRDSDTQNREQDDYAQGTIYPMDGGLV